MKPLLSLALLVLATLCTAVAAFPQDDTASQQYSYSYKGKAVSLQASSRFVALDERAPNLSAIIAQHQLTRDPLSARPALKRHGLGIYRSAPGALQSKRSLSAVAASAPGAVQPVFEQGGALLVPSDEVLVGFKSGTSLAQAQSHLSKVTGTLGITALRSHRRNIFIATISNPAGGRAFEVARAIAALEEVSFSEPNLVVVQRGEKGKDQLFYNQSLNGKSLVTGEWGAGPAALATTPAGPHWSVLASLDFESDTLPQGWSTVYLTGHPAAYWGSTAYRRHGGARSLYCAGKGSQAVAAPGPAPANMTSGLFSPQLNLSGYQEVYLELWFYAKNELDTSGADPVIYDYPAVIVVDDLTGNVDGQLLAIAYDGDCTKDPTTSNGWRKLLYRVPPTFHSSDAHFEIHYISNGTNRTEGAYIDDLRIVATSDLDSATLSNDTYSARQYELRNLGQVAGLANGRSDLHLPEAWELVTVSPDVVVAVIDEGVEPTHPDLNLVTGYDHDGIVGGQPRSEGGGPRGSHGTNCAGNVGAKKDNGLGVVGTAPGVKIMPVYMGSTLAEIADALDVAVQHGANVLSNSWGWTGSPSAAVEDAVKAALAAGKVVLFAAGNGPDRPPYTYNVAFPGSLTETTDVICVGASSPTDQHKGASSSDGEFYWGSSYIGAGPDVCAPGSWSYTTDLLGMDGDNDGSALSSRDPHGADYNPTFGGTSSSTPKVAGIVALMLSKNPALTPAQVKNLLMTSADDIEAAGIDDKTGAGRVNAYRAVLAVPAPADATPPTVTSTRPANGATSVALQTSIAATFAVSMDSSTVTNSTFTVDNGVTGTVSYNSSTRTATFTPSAPLSTGVTYTATIGTGARSASGVALAAPQSWSFRTTTDSSVNLLTNGNFESGTSGWTGADTVGNGGIVNQGGSGHDGSDWYLVAGNGDSINSAIYQDFAVAAGTHPALRFWYRVTTAELSTTNIYDTLTVQLKNPATGAVLQTLKTLSNLDAGSSWAQSEEYDLSPYAGQQLRLELKISTDSSLATDFLIDDVSATVPGTAASPQTVYLIRDEDGAMAAAEASGTTSIWTNSNLGTVVAEGDFNGDGVRDVAWWNRVNGDLHLQLMSGPHTVQGIHLLHREPDTTWRVVAAGDFDGDGKSDLVYRNARTGTVFVMLIDGTAIRGGGNVLTEADTAWKIVAATDLNGDGKSDLVWWHALSGEVAVTMMNGAAASTRQAIYREPDTNWRIVGAGDINGDHKGDLIWRNRLGGQVYAMLLNGTTVAGGGMLYTEPDLNWEIVSVGNYDSDDKADLIWRNASTGQLYLMPLHGLTVAAGAQLPAPTDTRSQVVGQQQSQDGAYGMGGTTAHSDASYIAWFNTSSGALYDMMIGGGRMTGGAMVHREPDTQWQIVGHGDFNGDGVTDSVWRHSRTGQVYLQYMQSAVQVKGGVMVYQEPDTDWRIVATGDLNGDGRTDLVWWNNRTGQTYGMLLTDNGVAGGSMINTEPDTNWKIVAVADVNGNGRGDLIWWNTVSGQVAIAQMESFGPTYTPVVYTEPDTNWRIAGAGDVNADGKADLVWHNRVSGQVYAMLMNGSSSIGGAMIHNEPDTNWEIVSVGNYDNDGKADLLWWNRSTGMVYLMPLNGLQAAPGHNLYREPDTNWHIQGETEFRDRAYGVGVTTTSR